MPCSNGASVKTTTGVESGASQSESPPKRPRTGKTKRKVTEGAVRENESFGGFGKGFLLSTPAERTVKTVSRSSGASKSTGVAGGNATPSSKEASTFEGERFSSGTSPTATTASDDITFLRAQPQVAANRGPVFPEVQEAMKEAYPLLNTQGQRGQGTVCKIKSIATKSLFHLSPYLFLFSSPPPPHFSDWATESLLEKIERYPLLSRALTDPHLSELLSQFQSNLKEALQVAAGNPEMQHFLREFCNLMGDHFTELADREEGGGKGKKTGQHNQPQGKSWV